MAEAEEFLEDLLDTLKTLTRSLALLEAAVERRLEHVAQPDQPLPVLHPVDRAPADEG